jgi:hypothetical protein
VGLRGLELRANHAVATNRSPAGAHLADFLGSNVAELPKNPPERTGNQLQKERYYRKFRAPRGALRFLPCRLDRRGGASVVRHEAVINLTEDLNVKICGEAVTLKICIVRVVCRTSAGPEASMLPRRANSPTGRALFRSRGGTLRLEAAILSRMPSSRLFDLNSDENG